MMLFRLKSYMKTLPVCAQKDHVLQQIHTQNITSFDETLWLCRPVVCSERPTRGVRLHLKCDGTRAETRFCLSSKPMSPFKLVGASVQSTTGSRGVRISGSNAGYTMFRGSWKSTVYSLHSPVSPSLPLPCVTMCHHISTGL
jgi:hypothetical protein